MKMMTISMTTTTMTTTLMISLMTTMIIIIMPDLLLWYECVDSGQSELLGWCHRDWLL
jgi:hypothetical protein